MRLKNRTKLCAGLNGPCHCWVVCLLYFVNITVKWLLSRLLPKWLNSDKAWPETLLRLCLVDFWCFFLWWKTSFHDMFSLVGVAPRKVGRLMAENRCKNGGCNSVFHHLPNNKRMDGIAEALSICVRRKLKIMVVFEFQLPWVFLEKTTSRNGFVDRILCYPKVILRKTVCIGKANVCSLLCTMNAEPTISCR